MLLILQLNSSIDLITGFHYYNLQVENPCITHRFNLCFFFFSEVLLLNTSKAILSHFFGPFGGCFYLTAQLCHSKR